MRDYTNGYLTAIRDIDKAISQGNPITEVLQTLYNNQITADYQYAMNDLQIAQEYRFQTPKTKPITIIGKSLN